MLFQKQIFRHSPENGVFGDCWRTAIACLLDLSAEAVPHSHAPLEEIPDHPADAWLRERGLYTASIPYPGDLSMEQVLESVGKLNPGLHFMFSGTSRTGCNHVVIAKDGEIVHDPSLTDAGIVGPCSDGNWWINFIAKGV